MNTGQWLGLVTGVLFGFLLQKGRILRFDKQVGAMLLKDMTIFQIHAFGNSGGNGRDTPALEL